MPNLLLCSDAFKISLNGKEAYFANHLNLQNLQMTQRFYYPQIPLNKECYIKLTVRSNVRVGFGVVVYFKLLSLGYVTASLLGLPGKGVQIYKNEFFHTPTTQVGLEGMGGTRSMGICITTALLIFPAILKCFITKIVINI